MLTLSGIRIYPIKSLAGVSRRSARVLPKGLENDRRWMLVDDNGMFMTQRVHTKMALFGIVETGQGYVISHQGDSITLTPDRGEVLNPFEAQIWNDRVMAYEVSGEHSAWFTRHLGISCRLVAFPEENPRQVELPFAAPGENVSLADAFPLMMIGEASMADLNSRLAQPVVINRFRPNLIFSGGRPYEEDTWQAFSIGGKDFRGVKRCARCVLTTVDPETGEKGPEPLKTLASYRKENNKIYFGQNVLARTSDVISVGDAIQVSSYLTFAPELKTNAHYDSAVS